MRQTAFTTVASTSSSVEAETMISRLRHAGLHPADLTLCTPLAPVESHPTFPVQVPSEEAELARHILHPGLQAAA